MKYNLLTEPLITLRLTSGEQTMVSLPAAFAALMRNEVTSFPALRPHQSAAWHCFLAQLGALALYRTGVDDPPEDIKSWGPLLRGLTPKFADDAPWHLVVKDSSKPAFLQPPAPDGIKYTGTADSPDTLDLLISQKNHDLKSRGYQYATPEHWMFALVSKQTSDGFNGSGNYGVARMNGGSSSRFCMGLVPLGTQQSAIMPGARLRHDTNLLLRTRNQQLQNVAAIGYPLNGGKTLLWLEPWPIDETRGLTLQSLDIWFIEICRRIRLRVNDNSLTAVTGTSKAPRVDAKAQNGVVGDPWAPVNKDGKTLTLGEGRLGYKRLRDLLLGGDWQQPISVSGADLDATNCDWAVIVQALGRGNSKTFGYHERSIIMPERTSKRFPNARETLHDLSERLIRNIEILDGALRNAIATAASDGRKEKPRKDDYVRARPWCDRLDSLADQGFFPTLWALLDADVNRDLDEVARIEQKYLRPLIDRAQGFLDEAVNSVSTAQFQLRARNRAERRFHVAIRKNLDWYYTNGKDTNNAAA